MTFYSVANHGSIHKQGFSFGFFSPLFYLRLFPAFIHIFSKILVAKE